MKEIALPTTDFAENAVVNVSRVFAVLWCIAQNIYRKGQQRTMKMIENEMNVTVPLEIIKASEIEPKEVKWLWYPYIPFGKVTLLQGDPGDRKSKLMLSIAALLSNGEPLPFTDEEETEPMTIIYQITEDDADDTIVPRFNSAGSNGENLIFIKEDEKSLSFGDNRIAEAIEKYHATSIENKCKIEYGTEQGLAALIYGEKGLSSLPIQDIAGEHIDTDNEYMYYYSVEFIK